MNKDSLGFISVKVMDFQQEILYNKVVDAGVVPIDLGEFHSTVIYDLKREDGLQLVPMIPEKTFTGKVVGIKEMGEPKDGLISAIALELDSPELSKEHSRLLQCGHDHTYPDFVAHVSLAYKVTPEEADRIIRQCESLIGETIYLHNESIQWIED